VNLSDNIDRKFVESFNCSDWEVETDTGYQPIVRSHKTIKYTVYEVKLDNNTSIKCADDHILIDKDKNEVFAKNSIGCYIITKFGASKVVSVENLEYSEHMYDLEVDSEDHVYYTNDVLSHNTQTTASFILHFSLFNDAKMSAILANKADQAQEILERIQLSFEMLPLYLQPGVKTYNKRSMNFGNNSKIMTFSSSSSSVRGKSIALLYVDETAFIPNDMQFYESTYPTIASGKQSKVILTSTPNGTRGMFYKLWQESISNRNSYVRKIVTWNMVPGRDKKWKEETIANSSAEQFRQEHECAFRGSSDSLLSGAVLETLIVKEPIEMIEDLAIFEEAKESHSYAMTVDCSEGVGGDFHAVSVIDITQVPYEVVATYSNNKLSPLLLPNLLLNVGTKYNDALILIENASSGGQVASDLYYDLEYENTLMTIQEKGKQVLGFDSEGRLGVKTSKQVKSIGCSTIKTLIENGKINLNDSNMISEFGDFVPKGGSYAAAEGAHDDMVMSMVLFGWLTTQSYFVEMTDVDIRQKLFSDMRSRSEEEMLPFGFIDDGHSEFDGNQYIDRESSYSIIS